MSPRVGGLCRAYLRRRQAVMAHFIGPLSRRCFLSPRLWAREVFEYMFYT